MIFAVLTCISLVLLGVSWLLYLRNMELFLCLLIVIACEFFYLLPSFVSFKYLLLPIIFVLLFANFLSGNLSFGRYGWWIIGFLCISLFGIVIAWFAGQGFMDGIKAAKFVPFVLIYFLLAERQIDVERFAKYFIAMGLVVAGLATITSISHGNLNFFPGMPKEMAEMLAGQTGRLRITIGEFIISAAAVIAFGRYRQRAGLWYLVASVILFAQVLLVQQTRGFIAAAFLTLIVVYVLSRPLTMLRIALFIILVGLALISSMALSTVDLSGIGFVKRIQSDTAKRGGSYGNSLQARLNAYDYYWKQIEKQPVTGRGLLNFNWKGNPDKELEELQNIHLSDIGIMHFLVQAGLVGFIWLFYGLGKLWKDIFAYREQLLTACYFIIGTFTLPTLDMFLRSDSLFLFIVFLGLSSSIIMSGRHATLKARAA